MGFKLRLMLAAALLLGTCEPALAYIDPGTGSILLQGLIGAVAAGLVVCKVYWSKLVALVPGRSRSLSGAEPKDPE
jgi:hypothetical protein